MRYESVADLPLVLGARAACRALHCLGYTLWLATNQACIARGESSWQRQASVNEWLRCECHLDGTRMCPHGADAKCWCRKPRHGMLEDILAVTKMSLETDGALRYISWMVGDAETDVEAGRSAGLLTCRLADDGVQSKADVVVPSLLDFARYLAGKPLAQVGQEA